MAQKLFGTSLLILSVCLVSVQGFGMKKELKCLDQTLDLKEMFKGWMECANEMLPKDDIATLLDPNTPMDKRIEMGKKAHKNLCIRVCQWKKHQHMLKDDGSLDEAALSPMIDGWFPEAAREPIKTGLKKCHEESSKNFADSEECKSYKGFEDCMKKTYKEACKLDDSFLDEMES